MRNKKDILKEKAVKIDDVRLETKSKFNIEENKIEEEESDLGEEEKTVIPLSLKNYDMPRNTMDNLKAATQYGPMSKLQKSEIKSVAQQNYMETEYYLKMNNIDVGYIENLRNFISRNSIQNFPSNHKDCLHMIHKIFMDEEEHKCDEKSIISYTRKLKAKFDDLSDEIRLWIKLEEERRRFQMQIESAFISRISYEPFKIHNIYKDKREVYGDWLKDKLFQIKTAMTCFYIHPCYMIQIIKNGLIPDDSIFAIICELYSHDWSIRTNYLLRYTLIALERDSKGRSGVSLNLVIISCTLIGKEKLRQSSGRRQFR